MFSYRFTLCGAALKARPSGALWSPDLRLLCVSDLHLGKSERQARRGGPMLPPYETLDTLARLEAEIDATDPAEVICLGDSFDDLAAAQSLGEEERLRIARMQAGRRWIWIEGNHDPAPVDYGGTHLAEAKRGSLTFRHIAVADELGEISGHYHPKATIHTRGGALTRPAFLIDGARVILPAFGTYTGGLRSRSEALSTLMAPDARAVLTGRRAHAIPMPRGGRLSA